MCKRRVYTFVSFSTHSPGSSPRGRGEEATTPPPQEEEKKEKEKKKGKEEEEQEDKEEGDSAPQYVILV